MDYFENNDDSYVNQLTYSDLNFTIDKSLGKDFKIQKKVQNEIIEEENMSEKEPVS